MKMRRIILHPLLFAVFPILFLAAHNKKEVLPTGMGEIAVLSALVVAGTCVFWLMLRAVIRDWQRAGSVASLGILMFFSFGHCLSILNRYFVVFWLAKCLLLAWLIVFVVMGWFLARQRRGVEGTTMFLNVASLAALVMPTLEIARYEFKLRVAPGMARVVDSGQTPTGDMRERPDIYYIILDAYARNDTLARTYGYDNREFTDFLDQKGFFVAEESCSNYAFTYLSLASSLNMEHVLDLTTRIGSSSRDTTIPYRMIRDNKVVAFLKSKGYRYVHFSTRCLMTQHNGNADVNIWCGGVGEFTMMLVQTTVLGIPRLQNFLFRENARSHVLGILTTVGKMARTPGPKFVFAHIIAPHPPFIFGPNGERVQETEFRMSGDVWEDKDLYLDQLRYINRRVMTLIDTVLADSPTPPVIILQGDHGPWFGLVGNDSADPFRPARLRERMRILNAYHVPPEARRMLYASISPVNSFRVVFNACLNADFGLLQDRSYFSDGVTTPYQFTDVTEQVKCSGSE